MIDPQSLTAGHVYLSFVGICLSCVEFVFHHILFLFKDAMELKLKQLKSGLDWLQHMDVVTNVKELPVLQDDGEEGMQTGIQDDFKREMVL